MRNKCLKEIYISKKSATTTDDWGNKVATYEIPIKYLMNVQPLNGSSDIQAYGTRINQMQKAICDHSKYFGLFDVDDIVYLDGANPTGEITNGDNANYRIEAILNQNKVVAIYFERIVGV